ncbi:receptor-like protein kinase FERONIA isoform X2 [Arachis duranensis]|uniref:Receptor-like protein kinase FERONIA isoform X2 n=1 Tax=Arachis duranensis TaxID=130453 RepID=A0A9C6TIA1_ARADU|nr:receptor-like protein kinase FERONIA isoform X2 [Arachis duranensis]
MVLKCLCFGDWKKGNASCSSKKQYPTVIEELCHPFSFHDLRKSTNNFDQKLIIGERALNKVYKGYLNHNNNNNGAAATDYTVALKVMTVPLEFKKEVEMLCQLHHPNIISLIGFCHHGKEKIAVYEYTDNGTLHDYLNNKDKEPLSWKKRLDICIGVARALHYLHSGGGLSTLKPKQIKVDKIVGTSALMAPEYAIHGIVTDKCDVYSFGLVLLHMVGHIVLNYLIQHEEHILEETLDPILRGKIAPECWQVFTSVIQSCLEYEADERPTMGEVEVLLEHALSLQQQADIIRNAACYTLSSTTPCYCRQRYNNHESLPR